MFCPRYCHAYNCLEPVAGPLRLHKRTDFRPHVVARTHSWWPRLQHSGVGLEPVRSERKESVQNVPYRVTIMPVTMHTLTRSTTYKGCLLHITTSPSGGGSPHFMLLRRWFRPRLQLTRRENRIERNANQVNGCCDCKDDFPASGRLENIFIKFALTQCFITKSCPNREESEIMSP